MSNKVVAINTGISVIGNSRSNDLDISAYNDANVNSFKTLEGGVWKSWSKGTPASFQGFDKLEKGKGYVVSASGNTNVTFDGDPIDINAVPATVGLNLIAMPLEGKAIANGYLPRMRINTLKTIIGSWKSYSLGSPDAFQGFLGIESDKGYVADITTVFDTYLDKSVETINDGVMLNKLPSTVNDSLVSEITGFDKRYQVKSIESDSPISISSGVLKTMVVEIEGHVITLQFPEEFLGKTFIVSKLDYTVVDYGSITESVTTSEDKGSILDIPTSTEDMGDIDTVQVLVETEFEFVFVENTNSGSPSTATNFMVRDVLEIMYDAISFNDSNPLKVMHIDLDGDKTSLSFAQEYAGRSFVVTKGNKSFSGVFTESSNFVTLTLI